jgi:hypothetical protein
MLQSPSPCPVRVKSLALCLYPALKFNVVYILPVQVAVSSRNAVGEYLDRSGRRVCNTFGSLSHCDLKNTSVVVFVQSGGQ